MRSKRNSRKKPFEAISTLSKANVVVPASTFDESLNQRPLVNSAPQALSGSSEASENSPLGKDGMDTLVAAPNELDEIKQSLKVLISDVAAIRKAQSTSPKVDPRPPIPAVADAPAGALELTALREEIIWLENELTDRHREISKLVGFVRDSTRANAKKAAAKTSQAVPAQAVPAQAVPAEPRALGRNASWLKKSLNRVGRTIDSRTRKEPSEKLTSWQKIKESGLFNEAWYSRTYSVPSDPITHYLETGAKAGFDPSELFSTSWYLEKNPDVAASGMNPLLHYVNFGKAERRLPLPF